MRAVRLAAAFALSAALLAGCGRSGGTPPPQGPFIASDLQQFTCADWKRSGPARRRGVIGALRSIIGGPVTGGGVAGRGSVLEYDDAYRLFEGHCRHSYAAAFVLYKIYGQAAGFAGVAP